MSLNIEQTETRPRSKSFDKKTRNAGQQMTYELVCIGFGTTALPLAASLAEHNPDLRVLFIERKNEFHWQRAHVLPDKPVGSSFLRDLVTTQNPRSRFTFVNFLHDTNQLIKFTNNSKIVPSRRLMAEYFRWAANHIAQLGWVNYGQEAVQVKPMKTGNQGKIVQWSIETRNGKNQTQSTILAKRVVLATGATPHIPQALTGAPLVLHARNSDRVMENMRNAQEPLHIAVVGADQEAAELFEHIHATRGMKHSATMFYGDVALRPEEEAASVQDMLDRPESMPGHLPPEIRQRLQHSGSKSPRVALHTLESLYEAQYTQKMHEKDARKWRFQMRHSSDVVGIEREHEKVRLVVKNPQTGETSTSKEAFDVVIAATGYAFVMDRDLVDVPAAALDGGAVSVDREYEVNFHRDALATGCGMWLLGSLEDRQQRSDNFACMAERANRAAKSILKNMSAAAEKSPPQYVERAVI